MTAARRVQRIGRMPSGYGKDLAGSAQAHTRASTLALRPQAARHVVSSSIRAMSEVSLDGARSIRPTAPCSVAAVISSSTDAVPPARDEDHRSGGPFRPTRLSA